MIIEGSQAAGLVANNPKQASNSPGSSKRPKPRLIGQQDRQGRIFQDVSPHLGRRRFQRSGRRYGRAREGKCLSGPTWSENLACARRKTMSAHAWNILGIIVSLCGVLLLFCYGMPYRTRAGGASALLVEGEDKDVIRLGKLYALLGWIGLTLVIAGALSQIFGELQTWAFG